MTFELWVNLLERLGVVIGFDGDSSGRGDGNLIVEIRESDLTGSCLEEVIEPFCVDRVKILVFSNCINHFPRERASRYHRYHANEYSVITA